MKTKKTILFLSLAISLASCEKEKTIPNVICTVVEQGSQVPIPFAHVQWFEVEGFGSQVNYVPAFTSIADENGQFEIPKETTVDVGIALANSSEQYSSMGFTEAIFTPAHPTLSIPISCRAQLHIQLINDENTLQNIVGASFQVKNGFKGLTQQADLSGSGANCLFNVRAHYPIELEITKHYASGNYSSEWLVLDALEANEINTYTLYY